MRLLKIVLVFVLLVRECHALQQSFGAKEIKTDFLRRLAVKEAENADEEAESHNGTEKGSTRSSSSVCKLYKVPVEVDGDLGWSDWVSAPPRFTATYCKGECPYPIPNSINSTAHAVFQRLVHSVNEAKVPGPCCVPIKFSGMDLLVIEDGQVIKKRYNEMIATECGCR